MRKAIKELYNLTVIYIDETIISGGGETYIIVCEEGMFVVKYPKDNEMNFPEHEIEICKYLASKKIPACDFVKNIYNEYLSYDNDKIFYIRKYAIGRPKAWNTLTKDELLTQARMLGIIHNTLKDYKDLNVGIGKEFFKKMTPLNALSSYFKSLEIAKRNKDKEIEEDLLFRIDLMFKFPKFTFDLDKLTCKPTHGDYYMDQIVWYNGNISAVIDWTSVCIHPLIWEITRSYVYASMKCEGGQIDLLEFEEYITEYSKYNKLNNYDIDNLFKLFFYQISVCDYYGQYYKEKKELFLNQAKLSTKLMRWFANYYNILK